MENGRVEYTFLWLIENYSYCCYKNTERLDSPIFIADGLDGTAWELELHPRGKRQEDEGHISLYLYRKPDDGPEKVSIKFEMSILTAEGPTVASKEHSFKKVDRAGWPKFLQADETFWRRKADNLPQDTLSVRCRLWKGEGDVRSHVQMSARTRIRIEKFSFFHVVENFSKFQPNEKQKIKVQSPSRKGVFASSSLYFTEGSCCGEKIIIEIVSSEANELFLCKCELSLLDVSGILMECGETDNRRDAARKSVHALPLTLTREIILNKKSEYLPGDKLSLLCECTFSNRMVFQEIAETLHELPSVVINQKSKQAPRKTVNQATEMLSAYPSVSEDIKSLYINQRLTDVKLETKTKSFSAHKILLCARSPVFEAMMTNEMKEKQNNSIKVDDLEDEIVEQLLLFLYSDNIDNLQWNAAVQLYYVADKYEIGKLRAVCSAFLVKNLTTTNVGELLLLADTHNDADLKKTVEDFILQHEYQVFGSEAWETLMETNPLLVMKAMHLKYKKRK